MKKKRTMYRVWLGTLLVIIGFGFLYFSDQQISTWLGYGICALGILFISLATSFVQELVNRTFLAVVFVAIGIFLVYAPDSRFLNWPEAVMWHGALTYVGILILGIFISTFWKKQKKNTDEDTVLWPPILILSTGSFFLLLNVFGYNPYYCFGFGSFFLLIGILFLFHQIKQRIRNKKSTLKNLCKITEQPS